MLKPFLPLLISVLLFSVANAQKNPATQFFKSGINYKNNNNLTEALTAFNKAVALKKNYDSAYVEIGNIYMKSGNVDAGISNYKKALAVNPKYTEALIAMGKIYRDSRPNYDSALIYYDAAVKTDSTNKETFYALAWTYNARKEYDNAIPNAIKALEIDNNYRPAYGELGFAYNTSKRYAEGAEQFKKNIAVSKVDVAMLYAGLCCIELKNKAGALEQYEELIKINEKMAATLKKKIDLMQDKN